MRFETKTQSLDKHFSIRKHIFCISHILITQRLVAEITSITFYPWQIQKDGSLLVAENKLVMLVTWLTFQQFNGWLKSNALSNIWLKSVNS
jgi:hypothetical protein